MRALILVALFSLGCATTFPKPANPHYVRRGALWFCYGEVVMPWGPMDSVWRDDPCRIDVCELRMPRLECIQPKAEQ